MSEINHVAAYGTLRSNHENHVRSGMREHVKSLGTFRVPGRMYAVPNTGYTGQDGADYPGVILGSTDGQTFEIELFEITGDRDKVLDLLDRFENEDNTDPEYRRTAINVDGVAAYIYEYIRPVAGCPQVTSGVWPNVYRYSHGHALLRYSADCQAWTCPACGQSGLDGEDSPSDSACLTR